MGLCYSCWADFTLKMLQGKVRPTRRSHPIPPLLPDMPIFETFPSLFFFSSCREKYDIPDGPIPYHLLLEDQAAKEAEEASREAMEAAIAREG